MRPILHVIGDLVELSGTERTLLRLVDAMPRSPTMIISLGRIADECRQMLPSEAVLVELRARSLIRLPSAALRLARVVRRQRPAVVMAWMYHANLLATLAVLMARYGGPLVWNVRHAWEPGAVESGNTRLSRRLGALLSGRPNRIVFNSERAALQHLARGFRSRRAVVIQNGVPLPAADPPPASDSARVGIASRVHPHKDHPTLLTALRAVARRRPDVEILICGRGATVDNPELAAAQAEIGADRFRLLGQLSDMDGFYRSIDVLALSSMTEALPNVLLEAMSHGVPCVTTDVGDAARVVEGTGLVVPVRDPNALAEGIIRLLSEAVPERARRRREARGRIARDFTVERMVSAYAALLDESPGAP